jgi:hypothetical protein
VVRYNYCIHVALVPHAGCAVVIGDKYREK